MNSLQREKSRAKSQSRAIDSLDSKYIERQTDPSQERYDDQRSGNVIVIKRLKIQNLQGILMGKPT